MAMRQGALDLQLIRAYPDQCTALEDRLQRGDHMTQKLAQIGKCPLLGPSGLVPEPSHIPNRITPGVR